MWASDGTPGSATLLGDYLCPGPCSGVPFSFPFPAGVTSELFFRATDGVSGNELWMSDGTAAGTQLLANIAPDDGTASANPSELVPFAGQVYFTADDGVSGVELWRSDGTAAGTAHVKDVDPGPDSGFP
jgi:ELWxxDGT repeat protein